MLPWPPGKALRLKYSIFIGTHGSFFLFTISKGAQKLSKLAQVKEQKSSHESSGELASLLPLFVRTWRRRNFHRTGVRPAAVWRASPVRRWQRRRRTMRRPRVANLFSRTPAFVTDGLQLRRATSTALI